VSDAKEFSRLACRMAYNHLFLSLTKDDRPHVYLKGRVPPLRKIVVVVGAGASNDACGLPTGTEAQKRLIRSFLKSGLVSDQLIKDEIRRITVEYRLEREDFEATLLALSKFDQGRVLKELNAVYNRRHYPSYTYEVLAHWLKHRFVDAIVNFNFDELLDQAIDDELGEGGCYRVVTDGDCPQSLDDWLDDAKRRFDYPLYIKPHGTASHKSTMRFTRASYSLLPTEMVTLLEKLFSDDVDVLVLGHAMQSVEFNAILQKNRKRVRLFTIGRSKPILRGPAGPLTQAFHKSATSRDGLSKRVEALSRDVNRCFKRHLKPRSVSRHEMIAKLFKRRVKLGDSDRERRQRRREYLADRIYVEIALAVSKAKGFLSFEHLAESRAGYYFKKLRRYSANKRYSAESNPVRGERTSLLGFCDALKLQRFGAAEDTLALKNTSVDRLKRPSLSADEFASAVPKFAGRTIQMLSRKRRPRCSRPQLVEALQKMYDGDEVEVSLNVKTSPKDRFENPTILPTLTSLHARSRRLMVSNRWDAILCTAESGEWLRRWKDQIKARGARVAIVVADETHSPALKQDLGESLIEPRWLPWWLHNRHVTVFLKKKQVVGAVFFERRMRTGHIVPMWLEKNDAMFALRAFVTYWIKAQGPQTSDPDPEIKPKQINMALTELLRQVYGAKRGGR
jgi:hypothetical protein